MEGNTKVIRWTCRSEGKYSGGVGGGKVTGKGVGKEIWEGVEGGRGNYGVKVKEIDSIF